ncbi:MAG: hypothetical protein KY475_02575 [Planctomycetes bacterium]|nr:hypothetical protein [Planctomycetota bacterium]
MTFRSLAAVLCVALLASAAAAETKIQPNFKEGDKFKKRETVSARQTLKIAGQTQETANNTVVESTTVVGKRNEQGDLPLAVTYTKIVSELTLPGGKKVIYNSETGEAKSDDPNFQIILDRLQAMKGITYTLVLDENNQYKSVSGLDAESGVDPEDVKIAAEQMLGRYPKEAVEAGETWEREVVLPLGAGQIFKLDRVFQYAGPEVRSTVTGTQRLEKIAAKTEGVEYAIRPGGALPGTVTKSDLKFKSGETRSLFDPAKGRTIESLDKMHITGNFTLSIMNTDLEGDLDLTMEMKSEELP